MSPAPTTRPQGGGLHERSRKGHPHSLGHGSQAQPRPPMLRPTSTKQRGVSAKGQHMPPLAPLPQGPGGPASASSAEERAATGAASCSSPPVGFQRRTRSPSAGPQGPHTRQGADRRWGRRRRPRPDPMGCRALLRGSQLLLGNRDSVRGPEGSATLVPSARNTVLSTPGPAGPARGRRGQGLGVPGQSLAGRGAHRPQGQPQRTQPSGPSGTEVWLPARAGQRGPTPLRGVLVSCTPPPGAPRVCPARTSSARPTVTGASSRAGTGPRFTY